MLGGFFAALVVLLFIGNWRATIIAAIAIPTSIISTYTLMWAMGFTLEQHDHAGADVVRGHCD